MPTLTKLREMALPESVVVRQTENPTPGRESFVIKFWESLGEEVDRTLYPDGEPQVEFEVQSGLPLAELQTLFGEQVAKFNKLMKRASTKRLDELMSQARTE